MEITKRQKDILFAIIEEYSETAAPVGSVTLAKLFGVSSATVRSEMSKLEEAGLVSQPHTSAGRIPTDAGYRYYVNSLTDKEEQDIKSREENPARLLPGKGDRGAHALEVRINSQERADLAIREAVDALVEMTGNLGIATIDGRLYVAGMARLFNQPEFGDIARVQSVANLLDNLEPWLREAAPGEPLNIFIGQENPIGRTSGVSLIISKFRSPYSDSSYIGVLGPTRLNYARVMSLVRNAGQALEATL
ncbi:transcriptional regulator [Candidatus Saccharibacteria bacterium]|nr:transcriptional regulator [Candidatus Saccharibacteria bacterium]